MARPSVCRAGDFGYARALARWDLRRQEQAMSEETPLVRQWILVRMLSALHHGASVKELAQEMGVSEKTIRRDLECFQQAGFPLAETVEEHGRKKWHVNPDRSQPGLSFALDEAIASVYLARRLMEPLAGTLFWDAVQHGQFPEDQDDARPPGLKIHRPVRPDVPSDDQRRERLLEEDRNHRPVDDRHRGPQGRVHHVPLARLDGADDV